MVPVADRHADYADRGQDARSSAPDCAPRSTCARSRCRKKIRDGEVGKVPFMLVVGDREVEQGTVTVRTRGSKDTQTLALADAADASWPSSLQPAGRGVCAARRLERVAG